MADERDEQVIGLLRDTAQLTAAAALSTVAVDIQQSPFRGGLLPVLPGLPRGSLSARHWIDGVWAATASGDAAMARRLARGDLSGLQADALPGEVQLAQAMAGWWRSEEIGLFLLASLEVTDPAALADSDIDHSLDVVGPAVGVFRRLGDLDDGALDQAFRSAGEAFAHYWARPDLAGDPRGFFSLPLSALARVATDLRRHVRAIPGVVPDVFVELSGAVLFCPLCDQPRRWRDPMLLVCSRSQRECTAGTLNRQPAQRAWEQLSTLRSELPENGISLLELSQPPEIRY